MMHWFLTTLGHFIQMASPIMHRYGLWALVGVLFAENIGVIFAPGEAVVVTAGFLAAKGVFAVQEVLPLAFAAALLGGYLAYGLGARYGRLGLMRYGKYLRITPHMIERVHELFHRYGAGIVIVGRYIVPLRQLQGYIAGSAAMGFRPYALWSTLGAALWVGTWGGGAWWLAQSIPG